MINKIFNIFFLTCWNFRNQVGDVNKEKLKGPEALQEPGKKEGQVIMVNVNGTVEAHQWSSQTQSWQKIGDVVGGVGSGNKQLYEGKEYDYVFDIDIGAGPNAMLKLPYNVSGTKNVDYFYTFLGETTKN